MIPWCFMVLQLSDYWLFPKLGSINKTLTGDAQSICINGLYTFVKISGIVSEYFGSFPYVESDKRGVQICFMKTHVVGLI